MTKTLVIFLFQLLNIFLLQDRYACAPSVEEFEFVNQIANQIPNQISNQNSDNEPELVNYKHNVIKNPKYHVDMHHAIGNNNPVENAQKDAYQFNDDDDAEYVIIKKKGRKTAHTTQSPMPIKGGEYF